MTLRLGEIGKTLRVNAAFDMSGNSDLELVFVKPDQTILTVNKAGGVTAPPVEASGTDSNGNAYSYAANEYWEYNTQPGDIDQIGLWAIHGRYIDITPKDFCGSPDSFTVLPC